MNLVSFSLKTKGVSNFARRLWTVFTRFSITEARIRRALHVVIDALRELIVCVSPIQRRSGTFDPKLSSASMH